MSETFATRIAQLSPERRKLLLERLSRASGPRRRAPRDGRPLALSFAQERLWFLWRMEPASPAYNAPAALRLRGPLDVPALSAALTGIVSRHEVLRTRYAEIDGTPAQVVDPPTPVELPVITVPGQPSTPAEPGPDPEKLVATAPRQPSTPVEPGPDPEKLVATAPRQPSTPAEPGPDPEGQEGGWVTHGNQSHCASWSRGNAG
ncbi:condensation domain-containing protein, partial [Acrocarpospora catenulata]|uniref:condensation domain-containing protein n=1 Tax=Acrocarpospora catenulata TaxID=2836182 RepID=UPI001BDA7EB4